MNTLIGELPKKIKSLFLSHGGGPLPLLGDPGHEQMIKSLRTLATQIPKPDAIIVVSAHWEARTVTLTHGPRPNIIYDYYGFPAAAYEIEYPAAGHPELAEHLCGLFQQNNIDTNLDDQRGFDHGLYIPLKLMYPNADIPCIQVSVLDSLDPLAHVKIGEVLGKLKHDNLLIIGSGFSFHNLPELINSSGSNVDEKNLQFEKWLAKTCSTQSITEEQRQQLLINWEQAPWARYCHPREEHLLPLHVCYGAAMSSCSAYEQLNIAGKMASFYVW